MPGVTFLHDCSRHCCCGAAGASWVGLFRHDLSKPEAGRKIKAAGSEGGSATWSAGFRGNKNAPTCRIGPTEVQRLWMFRVFQILGPEGTICKSQEAVWCRDNPAS